MDNLPAYEDFHKQVKNNLWVVGIPYGSAKLHFRFFVFYLLLILMVVAEASYLVSKMSSENFLEIMQLAPCAGNGVLILIKAMTLVVKKKKIYDLVENLLKLYQNIINDDKKTDLVKKDLVVVSLLVKHYFILNMVLISVYIFSSPVLMLYHYLTINEIIFRQPWAVLLPFSIDAWLPWAFVYLVSLSAGYTCTYFFTTFDIFYVVLTSHVCANFNVLSGMIESLDKNNLDNLADIVKEHQYILKLGDDLEDIFTVPNLFTVLLGSLQICALGFNLTLGSLEGIPSCILFLVSVLLQIFMMSYFGENIVRESSKIGDAAFLCKWYEMDEKSKKTVLTIMIRSQKPQELTAYKFSTICYASFTTIISTSWSYFTLLRTVYTPPEV